MFHITTCPTCQTRFSIPEKNVGTRQVCPHCQSPFVAGKSVSEGPGPMQKEAPMPYTMLGQAEANIRYNCPRCKKSLEAPPSEAGAKKPCPECGQRVQVPAPPPAPAVAVDSSLSKTLLGEDSSAEPTISYNCPKCKKPLEAPASEAGKKKPCPACGQRLQIPNRTPAATDPTLNKTLLAEESTALTASTPAPAAGPVGEPVATAPVPAPKRSRRLLFVGGGVAAAVLFLVGGMVLTAPGANAAREQYEQALRQIEAERQAFQEQKELLEKQQQMEAAARQAENDRLQQQLKELNEIYARRLKEDQDAKAAAELKARHDEEMRKLADSRADMERRFQMQAEQHKQQLELIRTQLKQANDKQTTIIQQQPVGLPFYHRFHPWYGWY